jgi:DNA-binding transcriptional ArsR family regulator
MRALAHPLRLQLLELIGREGALTATAAAELTGESVPSCSFHLRQLAKYGFIEGAPAAGPREKPWRLVSAGYSWPTTDDGNASFATARALTGVFVQREFDALQHWLDRVPGETREWQEAAAIEQGLLYLDVEQLAWVRSELEDLIQRAAQASEDHRTAEARPVRIFTAAFPEPRPQVTE